MLLKDPLGFCVERLGGDENRGIEMSWRHAEVKRWSFDQGVGGEDGEKLDLGHILKLRLGEAC